MSSRERAVAVLAATAVLTAATAGCSPAGVDRTPGPAPITVPPEAGPEATPGGPAAGGLADAVAAVDLAQRRTGGRGVVLERDDDGWEVGIVLNGRRLEVRTDPGATRVGAVERDGRVDDDQRALLRAVSTSLEDALEVALAEVPGTVVDAEVDDGDAGPVWMITVDDGTSEREVYVDADGGAVLLVEVD